MAGEATTVTTLETGYQLPAFCLTENQVSAVIANAAAAGHALSYDQVNWLQYQSIAATTAIGTVLGAVLGALATRDKRRGAVTGALIGAGAGLGYSAVNFGSFMFDPSAQTYGLPQKFIHQLGKPTLWVGAAGLAGYGGYRLWKTTGARKKGRRG